MKTGSLKARTIERIASTITVVVCVSIWGLVTAAPPSGGSVPLTVPKAICGPNDHPETGLQGQVPAALRATGFKGFNCNLELIGQSKGDGANWQSTEFREREAPQARVCAYHGTASPTLSLPGRTHLGVPVIDITDPTNPTPTGYLQTASMLDPWESLKVNERRQLLGADNGQNGGIVGGGPEVDVYDLSVGCTNPQLLASRPVGTGTDGGGVIAPVTGHEGSWAPDGLTYYGGDLKHQQYYAVDMTDPTAPKLITTWAPGFAGVHGLSISDAGTRGYFVSPRRTRRQLARLVFRLSRWRALSTSATRPIRASSRG